MVTGPRFAIGALASASTLLLVLVATGSASALYGATLGSGAYTVQDGAGTTIPPGPFAINADGTCSFPRTLFAYTARKTVRTYTITVSTKDKQGNPGSAVTTFTVQG